MKATFLMNQIQKDGSVSLSVVTHTEWLAVVNRNRHLPEKQRRYFIMDCIPAGKEMDCMFIEVPYEEYLIWSRERMAAKRNRTLQKEYKHISLDATVSCENDMVQIGDIFHDNSRMEDFVCGDLLLEELRTELDKWKPWGKDLLQLYLDGQKRSCSEYISQKYSVSVQTARKYKRQFEDFVKNFLSGVSV